MTTNDKPVCDRDVDLMRDVYMTREQRAAYTRILEAATRPQPAPPQVPENAACEAVYDAVTRANFTRDVKSPERKREIVRAALATPPAPEQPKPEWRCFQCGEVFTDSEAAALHFGTREHQSPACCIDIAEYRRMEAKEVAYAAEDSEIHHTLYAMRTQHAVELRRAEEAGYAKGLRDAEAEQPKPAPCAMRPYCCCVGACLHPGNVRSGCDDDREGAETAYIRAAFDYERHPIGSREWALFFAGWKARGEQPKPAGEYADEGNLSPEQCAEWLDAKYRRHGEIEDKVCADTIRRLSAKPAGDVDIRLDCGVSISVAEIHPDNARWLARLLNEAADIAERKRQQGEA